MQAIPGATGLEKVLAATMHTDFAYVRRDPADSFNTWLLGSAAPPRTSGISHAERQIPAPLGLLATRVADRIGPALPGGSVYTDNRAPVEWLIDQSLLDYAAGER